MSYEGLDKFLVKTTLREIDRLDRNQDQEGYLHLAENVLAYIDGRKISPNQAEVIFDAVEWTGPIPEYEPETTSEGLTLQDVSDGLADLSEVVSELIDPEQSEEA